jgi:hypothetical protein
VLDVYRDMNVFNEIPIFMQVAEAWKILVIDRILMHKRTSLATYRQAATEVHAMVNPLAANPPPPDESRSRAHAGGRAGRLALANKVLRHLARVGRYHWEAFVEMLRASERLSVPVGVRTSLRVEAAGRLLLHMFRLFWRRSRQSIPDLRAPVERPS